MSLSRYAHTRLSDKGINGTHIAVTVVQPTQGSDSGRPYRGQPRVRRFVSDGVPGVIRYIVTQPGILYGLHICWSRLSVGRGVFHTAMRAVRHLGNEGDTITWIALLSGAVQCRR